MVSLGHRVTWGQHCCPSPGPLCTLSLTLSVRHAACRASRLPSVGQRDVLSALLWIPVTNVRFVVPKFSCFSTYSEST